MKENNTMGKVFATVEVSNAGDEFEVKTGKLAASKIRKVQIETLVDTGATMLVLAPEHIQELGLQQTRLMRSRSVDGTVRDRRIFGPVTVKVGLRTMQTEAAEGTKGVPNLLGQIPLEALDLLVDSKNQRLIFNPLCPDPEMGMMDIFCNE